MRKSNRNRAALGLCGAIVLTLLGCGGSGAGSVSTGGGSIVNPPPVHAAGTFTNANLSGTYAISYNGGQIELSSGQFENMFDAVGTIQFDGAGNISGGAINTFGTAACGFALSGTYTVNPDGSATLTPTGTATGTVPGCSGAAALGVYSAELSADGSTAVFAESDFATTGEWLSGSAVKQQ